MIDNRFYIQAGPFTLSDLVENFTLDEFLTDSLGDETIHSPANLKTAQRGQISFLANRKRKADVVGSKATACFVTEKLAPLVCEEDIVPIITSTPRAYFARTVGQMVTKKTLKDEGEAAVIASTAFVHPTSVIGAGAHIADGAYIGPHCILGPGVTVGKNSVLEGQVAIECADIGEDCLIKNFAQIGGEGFGMDQDDKGVVNLPHIGRVILGDRVRIGAQTCVDRGFLGDTIIESDVKIDNLVQVAHNCVIGEGTMLAGHVGISGSCLIGKNVKMGGAVGIADHLIIGDGVQIAASSGVMNNIPAGEFWGGTPALPAREQARLIAATRKLVPKKK